MYKLLTFVIENTEDDGCVYEFYCPCPAKGVHQITNECVFRYEKIPLRLAEGHDYIPHDQDFIGMLEKWKIKSLKRFSKSILTSRTASSFL